jgi:hypothetical protein
MARRIGRRLKFRAPTVKLRAEMDAVLAIRMVVRQIRVKQTVNAGKLLKPYIELQRSSWQLRSRL